MKVTLAQAGIVAGILTLAWIVGGPKEVYSAPSTGEYPHNVFNTTSKAHAEKVASLVPDSIVRVAKKAEDEEEYEGYELQFKHTWNGPFETHGSPDEFIDLDHAESDFYNEYHRHPESRLIRVDKEGNMIEEIHHQENWDEWYSDYHPQGHDREDGINPTFEEWLTIFDLKAEDENCSYQFDAESFAADEDCRCLKVKIVTPENYEYHPPKDQYSEGELFLDAKCVECGNGHVVAFRGGDVATMFGDDKEDHLKKIIEAESFGAEGKMGEYAWVVIKEMRWPNPLNNHQYETKRDWEAVYLSTDEAKKGFNLSKGTYSGDWKDGWFEQEQTGYNRTPIGSYPMTIKWKKVPIRRFGYDALTHEKKRPYRPWLRGRAESFGAEENEMCPSCDKAKINQNIERYLVCPLCDWRSDEQVPCRHLNIEITDTDYAGEYEGGVIVYASCEDCGADLQAFGVWEE